MSIIKFLEKHDKLAGVIAALFLPVFYLVLLTLFNGLTHGVRQTIELGGWIALLSLGLGLQTQLYFRLRRLHGEADVRSTATAGGASAGAMLACCAHHASDVLPAFGLAALASLLAYYQDFFLLFGLLSNAAGLLYMTSCYQKARFTTNGPLDILFGVRLSQVMPFYVVASAAVLLAFFFKLYTKRGVFG